MLNRMSTYGTGNYDTSTYRTYAANDNRIDWGWLGLLGLLGLAGLRSRNNDRTDVR